MISLLKAVTAAIFAAMLVGCAKPLPRYPDLTPEQAIETLRARDRAIRSLSAEATLLLTNPDGSSVTLDAAIAAQWPGFLRIRAWKFGHPAFDLTCTPESLWIYIPEEAQQRMGSNSQLSVTAGQFRTVWSLLGPEFLTAPYDISYTKPGPLVLRRPLEPTQPQGVIITCEIDPETLTVQRYRFEDRSGHARQTLSLSSYRVAEPGPLVWPRTIAADGDSGRITIRLREPQFNVELPPSAFTPPRRAIKQP